MLLCLFWFSICSERKKRGLFGGFSGFVLFFNANEKEEKSQGGCARQVLDISPAVQAEDRNCGLVEILG